jgi:hypothetical protein
MGIQEQKFILPSIFYNNQINIEQLILDYLKDSLTTLDCVLEDKNHIIIDGYLVNDNDIYVFINISLIKIDNLYLSKNTDFWFALTNEIINTRHICNIKICDEVTNFFVNNIKYLTEYDNIIYPSPEVVYVGAHYKRVEFQNIFGISKNENKFGNNFYFTYLIDDAFINGSFSKDHSAEYRFGKLLTDDANGRYIEGGINRIAILLDKVVYICEEDVDNLIYKDEWINYILDFDCVFIILKCNKILIMIQEYARQYPLSHHKINKKTVYNDKISIL